MTIHWNPRRLGTLIFGLLAITAFAMPAAMAAAAAPATSDAERLGAAAQTGNLWQHVSGKPSEIRTARHLARSRRPSRPAARPHAQSWRHAGRCLPAHRSERTAAAKTSPLVLALPAPDGQFQRFTLADSPVMEAGLAARHPDIKTYRGRGIDDPTATIRADMTPLGFHASVRSTKGAWYIDPYYHLDTSVYVSYYARDLKENPHGAVPRRRVGLAEISADHVYYRSDPRWRSTACGFAR